MFYSNNINKDMKEDKKHTNLSQTSAPLRLCERSLDMISRDRFSLNPLNDRAERSESLRKMFVAAFDLVAQGTALW